MRWLPLAALALLVAGCGATSHVASRHPARRDPPKACMSASAGFRSCDTGPPQRPNQTLERLVDSKWVVVSGPMKPRDTGADWGAQAWLSPDGQTLLAEWAFPCDSAVAVFVPAAGGKPRVVTGEIDWRKAPVSHALGWTRDGRARVQIYESWRGHRISPRHPRVFLFDPRNRSVEAHPAPLSGC